MEYPGHCYSTLERAVREESFEGIAPVLFSRHICRWFYRQVSAQKADNLILWSTGHVEYRPFLNKHNDSVPGMLHYVMDFMWICIMFVWNCRAVTWILQNGLVDNRCWQLPKLGLVVMPGRQHSTPPFYLVLGLEKMHKRPHENPQRWDIYLY